MRAGPEMKQTSTSLGELEALDNLWCRTRGWPNGGSGSRADQRVGGEFVGHYIGDGYLITFPLISHGEQKNRGEEIGSRKIE